MAIIMWICSLQLGRLSDFHFIPKKEIKTLREEQEGSW